MITVPGTWQFHTGDDVAWANPAFNDSNWQPIFADQPWSAQGHAGYAGFAWYRKHTELGVQSEPLGLLIPEEIGAYEVYWNGQNVGSSGRLPPAARWYRSGRVQVFPIGGDGALQGVICLRFWAPPWSTVMDAGYGGLHRSPQIGTLRLLQEQAQSNLLSRQYERMPDTVAAVLMAAGGLLSLAFFLGNRHRTVYLGLALVLLGNAGYSILEDLNRTLYFANVQALMQLSSAGINIGLWLALLFVFALDRSRDWRILLATVSTIYLVAELTDAGVLYFWQYAGTSLTLADTLTTAIYGLLETFPIFLVGFGLTQRRSWSAVPLGVFALLYGSYIPAIDLSSLINLQAMQAILDWHVEAWGFSFSPLSLLNWLLVGTLVITVFLRQIQESGRQALLEQEMRSAQEVQHVLIPEEISPIPGLSIASVYKPAAEVGGDFFQVIPPAAHEPRSGTMIAVGDVSGKGLKAAMMVSLIVGTLRTLVEGTRSPSELLAGLNRRLLGRTQGGFVTCLVLRIDDVGNATLANAGHLPPFRNGAEWESPPSIPLGLMEEVAYAEVTTCLHDADTITLITDGVPEATNAQGELLGFERLMALMQERPSAERIAEAACSFGQEDDITVVSITWTSNT